MDLDERVTELERKVAALEAALAAPRSTSGARTPLEFEADWATQYRLASLEMSETWIELHEHSARPHVQRLLRELVEVEGPVTDRLAVDRIRSAWGLKRAGGRVQDAIDQSIKQLLARGLVVRVGDAIDVPERTDIPVRIPAGDEATRRSAEDVPLVELARALSLAVRDTGGGSSDDVSMSVAKLFGWTRRGGSIQTRMDQALKYALDQRWLEESDGTLRAAEVT